jgi:hypothetical protein
MKKIIVICTEIKEYILGIAVSSKMFDENMQPVIDKSDNRHVGQISSNLSWAKQDCGYERYGIVLDRIFPEANGNFDFEYRFVPLTKTKTKTKTNMVVINGVSIDGNSRSVVISNGKVIVNGKDVTPEDTKDINIVINGHIETLDVDTCNKITITGDVGSVSTLSGDVNITGNVLGSVKTMSGDVDCEEISGSVKTMSGDIKHRKVKQ